MFWINTPNDQLDTDSKTICNGQPKDGFVNGLDRFKGPIPDFKK